MNYIEHKSNESIEDYLEAILMLSEKLPYVRSVDVANEEGYKKSSISVAMKNLRNMGYITMNDHGHIFLTEEGLSIASMIYERHQLISKLLMAIGVDEAIAVQDACRIEHVLSPETFATIKAYIDKQFTRGES